MSNTFSNLGKLITDTLVINTLGTGTSVNNLGIDGSGNVVFGTTGDTDTNTFVIAGTFNDTTNTLSLLRNDGNFVNVSGFTGPFTGNTSGDCINDIFVKNIHSCSPLNINPNNEGNVYFGSSSGITIDLTNERLGIGTSSPQYSFQVLGTNSTFYYDPTSAGGRFNLSGNTRLPRYDISIAPYLTKPATGGSFAMRSWDDTLSPGYGKVGDMSIYAGNEANGLNLINGPGTGTEDYIRFYVGQTADGTTPDLHIQGSGSTRGYVGIGISSPSETLDVNGNTKISGSLNIGNILRSLSSSATGTTSFAFGFETKAHGNYSHAEGNQTTAIGIGSHSEGLSTIAQGNYSHAEGGGGIASGLYSHTEGRNTYAIGPYSHAEGDVTSSVGNGSHAEGRSTTASGNYSHAEGNTTQATGTTSHAEGFQTKAHGNHSHAEGYITTASQFASHAEGRQTVANGLYTHAEGYQTTATGQYSHAQGYQTVTTGLYSHAQGFRSTTNSDYSHVGGRDNSIENHDNNNIYGGKFQTISASTSINGCNTVSGGYNNQIVGGFGSVAMGIGGYINGSINYHFGQGSITDGTINLGTKQVVFGDGVATTGPAGKTNTILFDIFNGNGYWDGAADVGPADYAEYFEWNDGNTLNEDRVGYFVSLVSNTEKIEMSNNNVIGIVSAKPAIVGDSAFFGWQNRYVMDEWGRDLSDEYDMYQIKMTGDTDDITIYISENDTVYSEYPNLGNPNGVLYNESTDDKIFIQKTTVKRINPSYDPTQQYISRQNRPEWSAIGLLGKLRVKTAEQITGPSVSVNSNGMAINGSDYPVLETIKAFDGSYGIVKVLFK